MNLAAAFQEESSRRDLVRRFQRETDSRTHKQTRVQVCTKYGFKESEHPRADDGKFTDGGSSNLESKTFLGTPVKFKPRQDAYDNEITVMVDPAKLDQAWSRDQIGYIPKGGGGPEIEGRMSDFRKFMATGKPIEASRVGIDASGKVQFGDGRHRFRVLKDAGIKKMAVTIDKEDLELARKFLGAEE